MAVFEKTPRLRHIGHLDIQRAVQRALRRSGFFKERKLCGPPPQRSVFSKKSEEQINAQKKQS